MMALGVVLNRFVTRTLATFAAAIVMSVALAGASAAMDLKQAAWMPGTTNYKFGFNSIPSIPIVNAPDDTDWRRSAMLHDGSVYRLYFFQAGTSDTLYQFGFNTATNAYEWGYDSIPVLKITGAPRDASARSFAMLHDGSTYRLYLRDRNDDTTLLQFGFNPRTQEYEFGYNSIPRISVTGFPADADWSRWAMLHDGSAFRLYAASGSNPNSVYQAAFNATSSGYEYGYNSIPTLTLVDVPASASRNNFAMMHDGTAYRFYLQGR